MSELQALEEKLNDIMRHLGSLPAGWQDELAAIVKRMRELGWQP